MGSSPDVSPRSFGRGLSCEIELTGNYYNEFNSASPS
jgi:hypothetical protein